MYRVMFIISLVTSVFLSTYRADAAQLLPSPLEMKVELGKAFKDSPFVRKKVLRKRFYGLKKEIELYKRLIGETTDLYRKNSDGTKTKLEKSEYKHCKNIGCLGNVIWGEKRSLYLLYLLQKYNLNASEFKSRKGSIISVEELEIIVEAMASIPNSLLQGEFMKRNKYIGFFQKKDYDCSNRTDMALAYTGGTTVTLYPRHICKTRDQKIKTIVHEFGHAVSNMMNNYPEFAMSDKWLSENGYFRSETNRYDIQRNDKACLLTPYSYYNPAEDFAETFKLMILEKETVMSLCPDKYELHEKLLYMSKEEVKAWLNS